MLDRGLLIAVGIETIILICVVVKTLAEVMR